MTNSSSLITAAAGSLPTIIRPISLLVVVLIAVVNNNTTVFGQMQVKTDGSLLISNGNNGGTFTNGTTCGVNISGCCWNIFWSKNTQNGSY